MFITKNRFELFVFIILCLAICTNILLLGFMIPFAIIDYIAKYTLRNEHILENINLLLFILPCLLYFIFIILIFPIIYNKTDKSGIVFYILEKIRLSNILKIFVFVGILICGKIFNKLIPIATMGYWGLILGYISLLIYYSTITHKKQS